mmetsp:Transcript_23328/g.72263  ORF Transcript_23328/g.72263 Transcript_23328/m.72263 type:complete len:279 (+) Transcript_23328:457-1293(+)
MVASRVERDTVGGARWDARLVARRGRPVEPGAAAPTTAALSGLRVPPAHHVVATGDASDGGAAARAAAHIEPRHGLFSVLELDPLTVRLVGAVGGDGEQHLHVRTCFGVLRAGQPEVERLCSAAGAELLRVARQAADRAGDNGGLDFDLEAASARASRDAAARGDQRGLAHNRHVARHEASGEREGAQRAGVVELSPLVLGVGAEGAGHGGLGIARRLDHHGRAVPAVRVGGGGAPELRRAGCHLQTADAALHHDLGARGACAPELARPGAARVRRRG